MRIFSGIQPTGRKHLGNYIGAIRQYVDGQERAERDGGESIYCVVDLHALSVPYDPAELRERLYDTTAILIAAGLDPERCILFRQSDVREHTELTWLLSAVTAHGDLNRMTQFKEKSAKQRELVSAALFLYPVLQAADVLAYKAEEVPVGDDQRQHVELMREIARRFNERFAPDAPILVVPELPDSRGRRAGDGPPGPDGQDVDHRRLRAGHGARPRPGGRRAQEGDERGHRLGLGGRPGARQGGDLQPDRDPLGRARRRPRGESSASSRARATATSSALWPTPSSPTSPRCASATPSCAPTRTGSSRSSSEGAEKARAIAAPTVAEVRDAMGIGPARD